MVVGMEGGNKSRGEKGERGAVKGFSFFPLWFVFAAVRASQPCVDLRGGTDRQPDPLIVGQLSSHPLVSHTQADEN